ncbi:histidine phosphatase family protein [Parvularcula sp. ZS-1/3]|uniref:Histidine phosphatase family protein n=1 Tax=Parvularcula mediterranea TaxID=2732508 RepID=A0A7Y3RMK5_9PROT|nr:histidine phosphatase family protein [Parvularcula mediterranea]NNU16380.1 histidine phosphatase family protein [Parvularcula mediterranea]
MTGMIVTARHGRPNVDRSVKITAREYGFWWANYDKTGLAPGQTPPDGLVNIASEAEVVLCSTLPRAIETADRVTNGARIVPRDALFVEAPLPPPPFFPDFIKLTPTTWGVISRAFWFVGYAPEGCESHRRARRRVKKVVERLTSEVDKVDGDVLLCAHGYLNWMVHRVLIKRGWKLVDHQGGNDYWSHRAYRRQTPPAAASGRSTEATMAAE